MPLPDMDRPPLLTETMIEAVDSLVHQVQVHRRLQLARFGTVDISWDHCDRCLEMAQAIVFWAHIELKRQSQELPTS